MTDAALHLDRAGDADAHVVSALQARARDGRRPEVHLVRLAVSGVPAGTPADAATATTP